MINENYWEENDVIEEEDDLEGDDETTTKLMESQTSAYIYVSIFGHDARALVDSGSDTSLLSYTF